MTRGILIAGNESALFNALALEAGKRVERFAAAVIPNRFSGEGRETVSVPGSQIPIPWNTGSPVSARSLVLAAENRLEHIDEAVLVCIPPGRNGSAAGLAPADIEILVNDHIKGWFFLVRELALVFKARGMGILAMAVPDFSAGSNGSPPDLLGSAAAASFYAFTQGLLAGSSGDLYQTLGFSGSCAGEEAAFAAFVFKTMEESGKRNSGRWHKFGRLSIFGR